jgi:hypothetical protein
VWLTSPSFAGTLTIADIVKLPTPKARTELVTQYVKSVWSTWAQAHEKTIAEWYDESVLPDKL